MGADVGILFIYLNYYYFFDGCLSHSLDSWEAVGTHLHFLHFSIRIVRTCRIHTLFSYRIHTGHSPL